MREQTFVARLSSNTPPQGLKASILTAQNYLIFSEPFVLLSSESLGEDIHKLGSSRHVVEGAVTAFNLVPEELVVFDTVVELGVPSGGDDGLIVDAKGIGRGIVVSFSDSRAAN